MEMMYGRVVIMAIVQQMLFNWRWPASSHYGYAMYTYNEYYVLHLHNPLINIGGILQLAWLYLCHAPTALHLLLPI
eukprot:scaffold70486_cov20-Prasinocladus_malaysianus.AAC.2